jgi:hypothetical protein
MVAWMFCLSGLPALAADQPTPAVAAEVSDEVTEVDATPKPGRVKAGLWKLRRELRKAGRYEDAQLVTKALRNPDIMESLVSEVCSGYAKDHPNGVPGNWIDELMRFFEWFIENADQIIELILLLISIFDPPPETVNTADGPAAEVDTSIEFAMAT